MADRGWIVLTDSLTSINCWRWSVVEHYSLDRWFSFVKESFPLAKGYAVGTKLFEMPSQTEVDSWGERRLHQELDSLRSSLSHFSGRHVQIFVKDSDDLRREKYAATQAAKPKKEKEAKSNNNANDNNAAKPFHPTQKKEKKKKEGQSGGGGKQPAKQTAIPGNIDIRVGMVVSAAPHPDGDTLYVEQIDVGEAEPRTIVSGIREHVPLVQFVGARVLVMCNLKEKPLRGVASNGMIMCAVKLDAAGAKVVRLLEVPAGAIPGTRVLWGGVEDVAADPTPVSNGKLAKLLKLFRTDANGAVVWGEEGLAGSAAGEAITCREMPGATVG